MIETQRKQRKCAGSGKGRSTTSDHDCQVPKHPKEWQTWLCHMDHCPGTHYTKTDSSMLSICSTLHEDCSLCYATRQLKLVLSMPHERMHENAHGILSRHPQVLGQSPLGELQCATCPCVLLGFAKVCVPRELSRNKHCPCHASVQGKIPLLQVCAPSILRAKAKGFLINWNGNKEIEIN